MSKAYDGNKPLGSAADNVSLREAKAAILAIIDRYAEIEWEKFGRRKALKSYQNAMRGDTHAWCCAAVALGEHRRHLNSRT